MSSFVPLCEQLLLLSIFQQGCHTDVGSRHSGKLEPGARQGGRSSPRPSLSPCSSRSLPRRAALSPGPVQQLHLSQSLGDHSGKNQPEEDAAYQHVVIVILQDVELLRWVHSGLVDVQAVRNDLKR